VALDVRVYASLDDENPQVFECVDFVSLVSGESYGPPALVAPAKGQTTGPRARVGQSVLYLNTRFVPMFEIERTSD
jgi:hypothetical protein